LQTFLSVNLHFLDKKADKFNYNQITGDQMVVLNPTKTWPKFPNNSFYKQHNAGDTKAQTSSKVHTRNVLLGQIHQLPWIIKMIQLIQLLLKKNNYIPLKSLTGKIWKWYHWITRKI